MCQIRMVSDGDCIEVQGPKKAYLHPQKVSSIGLHAAHPEACQTKTIPVVDNVMRVYIMCVS